MLVSDFDTLWKAQPFRPFSVHTAGGESIIVPSPEFAWHAPAQCIVWIAEGGRSKRVRMVDLHLVTELNIEGEMDFPRSHQDSAEDPSQS